MNPPLARNALAADRPADEQLLFEFDRACHNGERPRIEDVVAPDQAVADPARRRRLLAELIKIDLEYRCQNPEGTDDSRLLEQYIARFPELRSSEQLLIELISWEYRARHLWSDRPAHNEYATRFADQAPVLRMMLAGIDAELATEFALEAKAAGANPTATHLLETGQRIAPAGPADTPALMEVLRRYQLLSAAQADELDRHVPQDPRALGKDLLGRGWLTPYQVNQLLQGRGHDLVVGPYLLLERLGEGGSGQVFKSRHRKMNRIVALKLLRKELLADADMTARFYREIQIVSQLDHPNVVHAYDAGPVGATHFLAMEYIEGADLGRLVKQKGPLPPAKACEYLRQAALGLQHAHERGLVHRDIKPHNLILSQRDGIIKLADLGLARLQRSVNEEFTAVLCGGTRTTGTLTPDNAVMLGTADYMAPEQALDFHRADIRADIYSLGCTFYYLLTSQPPFPGGTLAQKLLQHQQAEPAAIGELPSGVNDVLRKMLAKSPEDRYTTPAEVAVTLAALNEDSGAAGQTRKHLVPALPSGTGKPLRHRRWLVAASVAALVCFGAIYLLKGRETKENALRPTKIVPKRAAPPATEAHPELSLLDFGKPSDWKLRNCSKVETGKALRFGWNQNEEDGVRSVQRDFPAPFLDWRDITRLRFKFKTTIVGVRLNVAVKDRPCEILVNGGKAEFSVSTLSIKLELKRSTDGELVLGLRNAPGIPLLAQFGEIKRPFDFSQIRSISFGLFAKKDGWFEIEQVELLK